MIDGMLGRASPNIGLIVKVLAYVGDHSQFGRIWRCEAEYAILGQPGAGNSLPGSADFAQSWLRKIEPPPTTTPTTTEQSTKIPVKAE